MTGSLFGARITVMILKEKTMFAREFAVFPIGRLFRCNGNDYVKLSTRTARMLSNGRIFYFSKGEMVHPMAY